MSFFCPICKLKWKTNQKSIQCTSCLCWVHHNNRNNCSGLTNTEFEFHSNDTNKPWECDNCSAKSFSTLPFHDLDDSSWLNFNEIKINHNIVSEEINMFTRDTAKEFISQCDSIQNFINCDNDDDDDDNLPIPVNSNYYDIKQLNSLKIDLPSSFGLFHVNIASLDKHFDDLEFILTQLKYKFDVIGISEHKIFKDTLPSKNIKIPGYHEFIFEPTETTHGGTGFYIKDNVDFIIREDLQINSPSDFESIFIEIQFPKKKNLIVGCIYRHPTSKISVQNFTNLHLDPILQKINMEKKQCVFMGDFNVDLLKTESNNESNLFYNNLSSHFFTPFILQPTRLNSKTLIDNIFFNSLEYQSISGNLLIEISDHLIQFLILEGFIKERTVAEINLFKRDLSHFNEREFEEAVNNMYWEQICNLEMNDPNLSCNNFFNSITYLLDEFAPYKKVTKNEYKLMLKPWISKEILQNCQNRDAILKSISRENDPVKIRNLRNDYKKLRNEITKDKRNSKKAYFTSYFEKNKHRSSEIWKGIRALVNLKPCKSLNIKLLDGNNNLVSDPKKISNTFNDYFSTIGSKIERKIPFVPGNFKDYFNKKDKNGKLIINSANSLFLIPTVPGEVEKIIDALDIKKSTGPNSIPVFILKILKPFFSFWLSKLVNLCFEVGIFPDIFKIAKVTPLHKKDSKLNFLNYRPISLLSVFSKIYEKLIFTRIYSYLDKNNLIYNKQFGFRRHYSTNHALLSITEHIRAFVDTGHYVCGVFVDLEKAFDTVNHKILCEKLNYYGLRGNVNKLIQSYLVNRSQYVSINGFDSETKNLNCGVPQGSSLGPLLFLIYINDFRLCLDETDSGHFADDTFIMYSSKKLKSIETVVNTELKQVSKWLRLNKLSLNADKTELIFFHSKRHTLNYDGISIKFNNKKLIPVDNIKYLGMYIDKYLSWNFHINQLSKKLSRANGILSKLRHNAPIETCLQVYYAIFYSHLIYGCNIWGLTTDENLKMIEVLQKKCLRIMTFSDYNSHTNPLFINLKLLKVRDIIKSQQLKLVYEFYKNLLPTDLQGLFEFDSDVHLYQTNSASKHLLHIPRIFTATYGNKSIKYHCPIVWNSTVKNNIAIDNDIKNNVAIDQIHNVFHFKRTLKKNFLYCYSLNS